MLPLINIRVFKSSTELTLVNNCKYHVAAFTTVVENLYQLCM